MPALRIVTRNSPLALWQAEWVRKRLQAIYPTLAIDLIGVHTTGDKILDAPLAKIGGKGLFTKELEQRLLERRHTAQKARSRGIRCDHLGGCRGQAPRSARAHQGLSDA